MALPEDPNCPFCRKLRGVEDWPKTEIVWEFPHSVAVLGPWQYYHGYCILVARQHATELFQLDDDGRRAYFDEMCLMSRAIGDAFQPRKLNYELLGNQVPHLHWHLFPRYAADPALLQPVWVALRDAETDAAERQRLETGPMTRAETLRRLSAQLERLLGN